MAIEAHLSKFKKQNYLIYIAVLLSVGCWFAYDGYISKSFQEEHVEKNEQGEPVLDEEGNPVPDGTLEFNRNSPPYFLGAGLLVAGYYFMVKGRKIVAGDKSLVMPGKEIPYDSIEKITKTHFEKKGFFVLTYKDGDREVEVKLSRRDYDNMSAILDEIVKQIS